MLTHKLRRRVTRFGERPRDIRQAGFLLEGKPITYEDLRFERALAYNLDISNEIVVGTPKVIERNSSSLSSYSSSDQNKKLLKRPRNKKSKKKAKNTWAEDEAVAKELQRFNNEFDEIDDFQLLTEEAPRDFYVIKKRKRTTPKELQQINEPVVTAESSLFFSKQDSTQFTLNDTPLPPQQQQEENLSANISDENEIVPESPILNNSPIFKDIQEQQQFASISLKSPTLLEETTQKTIPSQVFTLDSTESVGIVQNVDVQSLSTAKEVSQNLTEKSSIICSSTNLLPPKRIFSSICEEKGNAVVDVIQLDSASSIQQISSKIQTRSMAKESSKICSSSNLLPKRIFSSISGSVQDKDEEVIQLDSSINQQPSSIHQSLSTAKESSKNLAQESSAISSITNLLPSRRIFSSINEEEEESREVIQLEDTSSIVQSKFNVFDSMRDSHHQTSLSLNIAKCPSNIKENILRDEAVPHSFASKKNLSQKDLLTSRGQQEHKSSENSLSFNLEVEVVEEGEYVLDEEENEAEKEEEEEMEEGEEEMEAGEDEVNDEEEMEVQKVEMGENEEEMEAGENELNGEEEEELEENEEEVELEDEEKEVECQEPSKSVEIQLVSTAKESSKNLSRKSSKLSSNLPPKRIFSSICEEVEEVQNVIQLDSASSIQQQSCSRIQQSLSTAKEASSIYQKSSLNTAKNISSQLIGKEAISKSRGQRIDENIPRDETVPHSFASKKNLSQKNFSTSRGQQEQKASEKSSSFNLEVEVVGGEYVLDEEENEMEKEEEEEMEGGEDEVNDEEEEEVEVNDEEDEVEDEEKEVECQEDEVEELEEDVIQLDSASSIQQQSCSRIQQSLSIAKEASSIHQKSSLNTAKNISSQPIEKEAISKSRGQRSSNKLSSSTVPYLFSPKTLQKSQLICDASRTQKFVEIFEGIEGTSKSGEKSFSTAKEISTRSKVQRHSKNLPASNLEELENTPPPSTSQQHQPRQQAVENLNRNASIRNSRRLSLSPWRQPQEFTHVLQHCNNGYIMTWDEFLDRTNFECIRKLGEGDYGEVYEMSDSKGTYAMKVIQVTEENPIPAVFSEVFITRHLSELNNAGDFSTPSYIPLVRANVVKGIYPDILIKAWKKYKKQNPKIALNKQPTERKDNTYVVLVMANGGVDLELYLHIPRKATKKQRFSIFYQVALSLAIAEERYSFEHRDLHYSNILISEVTTRERERRDKICYYYNGEKIEVRSHGVHASLIDFNNSRMTDDVTRQSVFVKFAVKPYKKGDDYQFKIYPMMKKLNDDDWSTFHRKTNHYWLHYLYDKLFKDRRFTLKEREDFEKIFGRLVLKTEEGGFETTKDFLDNEEVREIFDHYVF